MENRFRNFTLWFSLLLCLCIGSGGATRVILCFTADGRAKMELQQDANCAGVAKGEAVGFSQEFLNSSLLPPLLGAVVDPARISLCPSLMPFSAWVFPTLSRSFSSHFPLSVGRLHISRSLKNV